MYLQSTYPNKHPALPSTPHGAEQGRAPQHSVGLVQLLRTLAPTPDHQLQPAPCDITAQLAQWLSVADSITLHSAHNQLGKAAWVAAALHMPAVPPNNTQRAQNSFEQQQLYNQLQQQLRDLRKTLLASFIQAPSQRGRLRIDETEFAPHHQRYLDHQRRMDMAVDALRSHLQHALAGITSSALAHTGGAAEPLAQLAALDALLNHMLNARVKSLLSRIPTFLKSHFLALRAESESQENQAQEAPKETNTNKQTTSHAGTVDTDNPAWLARFEQSFQAVLQAELDMRLQPLSGMVQALSGRQDALPTFTTAIDKQPASK